jgi:hypothetical protein
MARESGHTQDEFESGNRQLSRVVALLDEVIPAIPESDPWHESCQTIRREMAASCEAS